MYVYDCVNKRLLPLQSREQLAVSQCCHSSEVLNLNNSLNVKIRKKKNWKDFLVPYSINSHQLQHGTYFPSILKLLCTYTPVALTLLMIFLSLGADPTVAHIKLYSLSNFSDTDSYDARIQFIAPGQLLFPVVSRQLCSQFVLTTASLPVFFLNRLPTSSLVSLPFVVLFSGPTLQFAARNVKFGMQVPITMQVTTQKGFFKTYPLKG